MKAIGVTAKDYRAAIQKFVIEWIERCIHLRFIRVESILGVRSLSSVSLEDVGILLGGLGDIVPKVMNLQPMQSWF